MKVFISWSKETSQEVAEVLRSWLRGPLPMLKPWVSSEDIDAGKRWGSKIEAELKATTVGILCVTPTNLKEPWLLFEGGALANQVGETARVIPYLFGMQKVQLKGPLSAFQAAEANEDGTFELLKSINNALDESARRPDAELKEAFEVYWPKLREKLGKIAEDAKKREEPKAPKRETNDLLEEILTLVRQIDRRADQPLRLAEGGLPSGRTLALDAMMTTLARGDANSEFLQTIEKYLNNRNRAFHRMHDQQKVEPEKEPSKDPESDPR